MVVVAITAAWACLPAPPAEARPAITLVQVSHDPFSGGDFEHHSEVEPDVVSHGHTVLAAFQVGRSAEGGAEAIGVAVSTDDARTWSDQVLGGSAKATGGRYQRASDPSVAFGAGGHGWLVGFLGVSLTGRFRIPTRSAILVARSQRTPDSFAKPIVVARAPKGILYDKPWVACDGHPTSPYFGRCYALWDEIGLRSGPFDVVVASTSTDSGRSWSPPARTSDIARGFGVIPLVRPDGSVAVVYVDNENPFHPRLATFSTLNGGRRWGPSTEIARIHRADLDRPIRDPGLPSAAVGEDGIVHVAWSDCRFEPSCAVDDIVVSNSLDGQSWTTPAVAASGNLASATSLATPGLGVRSSGRDSRAAIVYYATSGRRCSRFSRPSTCTVTVASVSSRGGDVWSAPATLGWPMRPDWFPCTREGCMWGDYIATTFLQNGRAISVLPMAKRPTKTLDAAMYVPDGGLPKH